MSLNVRSVLIDVGQQRIFGTYHASKKEGASQAAVLFLHGFNSSKNDHFRFNYDLAQELAEQGIASLRIDFRGCGDSDGLNKEMTIDSQVEDALAALDTLSQHHRQIGMIGRSLGSAIAIKAAVKFRVCTLVLISPVFDGSQWKQSPSLSHMAHLSIEEDLNKLAGMPILELHAEKDEVLSRHHLHSFQRVATPFHTIQVISNADHTYSSLESRKILGKETAVWFINAFYGTTYNHARTSDSSAKRETELET